MSATIHQFPTPAKYEPWVSEQQVAAHFGIAPRTVRRYRREGMPSRKLAGHRRYQISECERWMLMRGVA